MYYVALYVDIKVFHVQRNILLNVPLVFSLMLDVIPHGDSYIQGKVRPRVTCTCTKGTFTRRH